MTEWFVSGDPQKYDFMSILQKYGKAYWKQSANIQIDDIIYMYVSGDIHSLMFKCSVKKINLSISDLGNSAYLLSGEDGFPAEKYMIIEVEETFHADLFDRAFLEKKGVSFSQNPYRITSRIKDYLEIVQYLYTAEEMDPLKHDGCYEYMQEIINAYASMEDNKQINYKDINLVFFSCIGTWSYGFDKKKRDIIESHLSDSLKQNLINVLESIHE